MAIHKLRVTSQCGSPFLTTCVLNFHQADILGYSNSSFPADRTQIRVRGRELFIATSRLQPGVEHVVDVLTSASVTDIDRPHTSVTYQNGDEARNAVERKPAESWFAHIIGYSVALAFGIRLGCVMVQTRSSDRAQFGTAT